MQELVEKINQLPPDLKKIFERIYEIKIEGAQLKLPAQLKEKYGQAAEQEIVLIKNKILYQETAFNLWRAKRPQPKNADKRGLNVDSGGQTENAICSFCNPEAMTPEDEIGRLENEAAITASNLAKSLSQHSLVIFKKHELADLSESDLKQALTLTGLWFEKVAGEYKFFIWNQAERAGASLSHPHFQIFAADHLPAKLEFLQERLNQYQKLLKADYLANLFSIHQALGLAIEIDGLKIIVSLTPFKEKELIILGNQLSQVNALAKVLLAYQNLSDSFNFFWLKNKGLGFLVDRGQLDKKNSDIGSLEIYAYSVVGFNPLDFASSFFPKLKS